MKKKLLSILCIMLSISVVLVGCSKKAETSNNATVLESNYDEILEKAKGTTVNFYGYGDNEVMNKTEVAKNGNVVYLDSVVWYTMTGGIESTKVMIDEIADAIK